MRCRALLVLPVALAVVAAGCGSSNDQSKTTAKPSAAATRSAAKGPIDVKLDEWQVAPSAGTVAAGKVRITAANDGKTTHEMVVLRTDKPAARLGQGKRVSEAGSVGEIGDLKAGKTASKTFDLSPGHYVVICNLPGHYAAGMHTDLTVR
jgi:uncharacterized cupredoxin-like copper-binding protein